ncbi:MAG: hypothetical protein FWG56_10790 [Desulfovibrionaceae bacterium]|jgi:hypothetical protein|nr:hypothetical protein [Desulfovibrionaceae bacterium]
MSRKRCNRKKRTVATSTLEMALKNATVLTPDELADILVPLRAAFDRLRQVQASEVDWCVLAGCLGMAQNIERQGVVRGLREHLAAADRALCAVEARASDSGHWRAPALRFNELDAIGTFVDLHEFQLRQLSYAEFRRAYQTTEGQARSRGAEVIKLKEAA